MDIAKYLTTAVLLSSVFNDIKESWIIYFVVSIAIVLTLLAGLWLVRERRIIWEQLSCQCLFL